MTTNRQLRTDFSRGEAALALVWLACAGLVSVLLEVVYLSIRIPLPNGYSLAFPITIALAWWFNRVLTRTALLWTDRPAVAAIPFAVWALGLAGLISSGAMLPDNLVPASIPAVGLVVAGVIGGVWPILNRK